MVPSEVAGKEGTVSQFFRFPRTPHLAWLGDALPRDDKLLSASEARDLLAEDVAVEEKLDGANLGISVGADGKLKAQNRGQYLTPTAFGQFKNVPCWMDLHKSALADALGTNLILFGEWCAARHSLHYDNLPDWFVAFDVFDRSVGRFWSFRRRNKLVSDLGISVVPTLLHCKTSLQALKNLVESTSSQFGRGPVEGIVIRRESSGWLTMRTKLIRAEFVQDIGEHWRQRPIEWNKLHRQAVRSS
jgi:ATP-dependent RNA circularization protein (DNA/RNA ligase family)